MTILTFLEALYFDFKKFQLLYTAKILKIQDSSSQKRQNFHFWNLKKSPNLISRKIWIDLPFSNWTFLDPTYQANVSMSKIIGMASDIVPWFYCLEFFMVFLLCEMK